MDAHTRGIAQARLNRALHRQGVQMFVSPLQIRTRRRIHWRRALSTVRHYVVDAGLLWLVVAPLLALDRIARRRGR